MKRLLVGLAATALIATPSFAALKEGAKAPDFTLAAALAGKDFTYDLGSQLKKGPAVVYFYPAAFTGGCSAEAHEFAENIDNFKALGASVIGVSGDNIGTLEKFSTASCGSKFPVAADPKGEVIAKYDVTMGNPAIKMALKTSKGLDNASERTSFLVAPDGTILATYSAMDASKHVSTMLAALKTWRETHKA
jgi:peroxiredoxin Q/BCP